MERIIVLIDMHVHVVYWGRSLLGCFPLSKDATYEIYMYFLWIQREICIESHHAESLANHGWA